MLSLRPFVVAALGLAIAAPALAQGDDLDRHLHAHGVGLYTVTYANGAAVCEPGEPQNDFGARRAGAAPALTVVPSLNPPEALGGLRIVLRATDQLLERPDVLLSFRRAAARWERAITTPITVVYDIDYGEERFNTGRFAPSTIASASSATAIARQPGGSPATVAQLVARLRERAADDAQLRALYDAIPVPTPSTATSSSGDAETLGTPIAGQPTLQALGYLPAQLDPDPNVTPFGSVPSLGFNAAFDFDFDPSDGTDPDLIDFEAIVIHEMGHSLGFTSVIGQGGPPDNFFTVWDLFRVRPDDVEAGESLTDGAGWETAPRVVTPGPPATELDQVVGGTTFLKATQVFFDGLATYETSTATGRREGGDGQQASHWRDDADRPPSPRDSGDRYIGIMDPNFGPGVRQIYKEPDLRVLEVIGYGIDYAPSLTDGLALSLDGDAVDLGAFPVEEIALGDVAAGARREIAVRLANTSSSVELAFDAEIVFDGLYPRGVSPPTAALGASEGTIGPGEEQTLTLQIGGDAPAFAVGRVRIRTNADGRLVVELPFTFSVGGGEEPTLVLTEGDGTNDGSLGDLGNLDGDERRTASITIANPANLPLGYEILTGLQTTRFPFETGGETDGRTAGTNSSGASSSESGRAGDSALTAILGARRAGQAAVLFSADFATQADFARFDSGGAFNGRWQRATGDRAAEGGHSTPGAAYFGTITGDTYQYQNNASGDLVTPPIDVSGLDPADLVTVSFNYSLDAEEADLDQGIVYDFASVLYSIDGGETYRSLASNDIGGLIQNTEAWTSVMISASAISGLQDPVQFAFRFTSDGGVTGTGWFVDDIEIATVPGGNGLFVTPRVGAIDASDGDELVTLTVNAGPLERGFYDAVVQVVTDQRADDPGPIRFSFTVDDPVVPTLDADTDVIAATAPRAGVGEAEVTVTNAGDGLLTFTRILEPALSRVPGPASVASSAALPPRASTLVDDAPVARSSSGACVDPPGELASRTPIRDLDPQECSAEILNRVQDDKEGRFRTKPRVRARSARRDDGDVLGSIALPGAENALALTQLPDGRVLASEVGTQTDVPRTFLAAADLSEITAIPGATPEGDQILAVAYNPVTESLWYTSFQRGLLYEVELRDADELVRTDRVLDLGFQISSLDYSEALGAFLMIPYNSDLLFAYDVEGRLLPGYPVSFERAAFYQGLSITGGVVEIGFQDESSGGGDRSTYLQYDQFGRPLDRAPISVLSANLAGATRVNAHVRSRIEPNERFYYLTRPGSDGSLRIVAVDPPDLPEETQTVVQAEDPLYGVDLERDASLTLGLRLTVNAEVDSVVEDELVFLTNSRTDPIIRLPVRVTVRPGTTPQPALPQALAVLSVFPNPTASDAFSVSLDLPEESDVRVALFDALGRRVSAEQTVQLPAGFATTSRGRPDPRRTVTVDTRGLASGVYLVRVRAGDTESLQRVTLIR